MDLKDLVRAVPASAASGDGMFEESSEEDTSDEAFAARHVALEAEEQQRFNSFAGELQASFSGCRVRNLFFTALFYNFQ